MRFLIFYIVDCPQPKGSLLFPKIGPNLRQQWLALLTKQEFQEFLALTGLHADSGLASTILFQDDHQAESFCIAYVVPIPEVRRHRLDERDWHRIRRAVLSVFGRR